MLRNYGQAVIYTFPNLEPVVTLDLPQQEQGEGIAIDGEAKLWLSSEGPRSEVLRMTLPRDVIKVVQPPPEPTPDPTTFTPAPTDTSPAPQPTQGWCDWEPCEDGQAWAWLLAGLFGLAIVVVLVRSLRRPD